MTLLDGKTLFRRGLVLCRPSDSSLIGRLFARTLLGTITAASAGVTVGYFGKKAHSRFNGCDTDFCTRVWQY